MIDLYCERTGPGLWGEPLNTLSNASFLVAGILSFRLSRDPAVRALSGLLFAIGVGSALWHMFAERWAQVLDVLPTALFQAGFVWFHARRAACLKPFAATALVFSLGVATVAALPFMDRLNGTLNYAPSLLMLAGLGAADLRAGRGPLLLASAGLFLVSMAFRTIDPLVCGSIPFGTHFAWHLLNGAVLYLSMRALAGSRIPPSRK